MADVPAKVNVVLAPWVDFRILEQVRSVDRGRLNVTCAALGPAPAPGQAGPPEAEFYKPLPNDPPLPEYTDDEKAELFRQAHVIYSGFRFARHDPPFDIPNTHWVHFPFAGVSNLQGSRFWEMKPPPVITSSRGYNNALPIAETTMAGLFMLAKHLDRAAVNTKEGDIRQGSTLSMVMLAGKTLGIIGLGGIGHHLASLAKGAGMRVVATRRSAERHATDVDGVDELFPTAQQNEMLPQCDFVAICSMLTNETEGMVDREAFERMKDGAYLLNTARGEIIDEQALIDSLHSGKLAGAYLDVWKGMFGGPPSPELLAAPNLVMTGHVSGRADGHHALTVEVFCENLGRFLQGETLINAVDWDRGY